MKSIHNVSETFQIHNPQDFPFTVKDAKSNFESFGEKFSGRTVYI